MAILMCGVSNAQTTYIHPWMQKRVAYFGDSITDPRNSGSKKKYGSASIWVVIPVPFHTTIE